MSKGSEIKKRFAYKVLLFVTAAPAVLLVFLIDLIAKSLVISFDPVHSFLVTASLRLVVCSQAHSLYRDIHSLSR